jgi:hypothetical protein
MKRGGNKEETKVHTTNWILMTNERKLEIKKAMRGSDKYSLLE